MNGENILSLAQLDIQAQMSSVAMDSSCKVHVRNLLNGYPYRHILLFPLMIKAVTHTTSATAIRKPTHHGNMSVLISESEPEPSNALHVQYGGNALPRTERGPVDTK
jgi:hypothetical protein